MRCRAFSIVWIRAVHIRRVWPTIGCGAVPGLTVMTSAMNVNEMKAMKGLVDSESNAVLCSSELF